MKAENGYIPRYFISPHTVKFLTPRLRYFTLLNSTNHDSCTRTPLPFAEPAQMLSQPPIPPLLSLNLSNLPHTSLTLLTSTLGATTNWLVLRFICAALKSSGHGIAHDIPNTLEKHYGQGIVLVSWLRDGTWWKESGRKLVSRARIYMSGDYAKRVSS